MFQSTNQNELKFCPIRNLKNTKLPTGKPVIWAAKTGSNPWNLDFLGGNWAWPILDLPFKNKVFLAVWHSFRKRLIMIKDYESSKVAVQDSPSGCALHFWKQGLHLRMSLADFATNLRSHQSSRKNASENMRIPSIYYILYRNLM